MDRRTAILHLRAGLLDASAARDWERLGAATRALAPQLAALAAARPWSAAERVALAQLQAAHGQAAADCGAALLALERRLEQMRANKEGWMAYALDNEIATGATP